MCLSSVPVGLEIEIHLGESAERWSVNYRSFAYVFSYTLVTKCGDVKFYLIICRY